MWSMFSPSGGGYIAPQNTQNKGRRIKGNVEHVQPIRRRIYCSTEYSVQRKEEQLTLLNVHQIYTDLEPAMQIIHPPCVVSTDKVFWRTQLLLFFPAPVYSVDIMYYIRDGTPISRLSFWVRLHK